MNVNLGPMMTRRLPTLLEAKKGEIEALVLKAIKLIPDAVYAESLAAIHDPLNGFFKKNEPTIADLQDLFAIIREHVTGDTSAFGPANPGTPSGELREIFNQCLVKLPVCDKDGALLFPYRTPPVNYEEWKARLAKSVPA